MKTVVLHLLLFWGIGNCLVPSEVYAVTSNNGGGQAARQSYVEGFDIRRPPGQADWRFFLKSPAETRARLWSYHAKRGTKLGQWAWGWRLGWVRACGSSADGYCSDVLRAALFDKALVVRAEAATHIGRRSDSTGDAATINMLKQAFNDPRNMRGGRPIFVQERILFAIHRIGGPSAAQTGAALAGKHQQLATYWARLGRADIVR